MWFTKTEFLRDDNGGFAYIAAAAANYCDDNMLS